MPFTFWIFAPSSSLDRVVASTSGCRAAADDVATYAVDAFDVDAYDVDAFNVEADDVATNADFDAFHVDAFDVDEDDLATDDVEAETSFLDIVVSCCCLKIGNQTGF